MEALETSNDRTVAQRAPQREKNELPEYTLSASVETQAMASSNDAADDAAIWPHPLDGSQSLVIGTDKKSGLYVYDLSGEVRQFLAVGKVNNVDLRVGWNGASDYGALVAASDRSHKALALFYLDSGTGTVQPLEAGVIGTALADPYGLCLYHSAKNGYWYAFMTDKGGVLAQYRIFRQGPLHATVKLVRRLPIGSASEGCVADDREGIVYIAEEAVGIWAYGAEPTAGDRRELLAAVDGNWLVPDVEGLALAVMGDEHRYLLASSQGDSSYLVIDLSSRQPVSRLKIAHDSALGIDGVSGTNGIDIFVGNLGPEFPYGLLVAQDDMNESAAEAVPAMQNFKFVSWAQVVAGAGLGPMVAE